MAAAALEELAAKIDQVLASAAAAQAHAKACGVAGPKDGPVAPRRVPVKLKGGKEQDVDLTADLCLGVADDAEKLAKQLRLQGLEVQAVEIPRPLQQKEVLQWAETLSQGFTKTWIQKADMTLMMEGACRCGEGLIRHGFVDFAYTELYCRFADRMLLLRSGEATSEFGDARRASTVARFYLGRCAALYHLATQRDTRASREDTVDSLRDVLQDILEAMKYLNSFPHAVREELYWIIYNACLLAMRCSRWLRLHGFGAHCAQSLWWLGQCMSTCRPFNGVHLQPFRVRLLEESVSCSEAGLQLEEASRMCDAAVEQVQAAKAAAERELNPLPPAPTPDEEAAAAAAADEPAAKGKAKAKPKPAPTPTPKEDGAEGDDERVQLSADAVQVYETGVRRFKALKMKYSLWLGQVATVAEAVTIAQELGENSSHVVPVLLEALKLQHGLPERFGVQDGDPKEAVLQPEPPEEGEAAQGGKAVARFTLAQVWEKQAEILEAIVSAVKPQMDAVEVAAKTLEDHTVARLGYEEEAERRAGEDFDENSPEPVPPSPPDEEALEGLGFVAKTQRHSIEDALTLPAHVALAREVLRHELLSCCSEKVKGMFKQLERSLALRLRYRHFLCPPIVDIDATVCEQRDRSKVGLPEKYEFLSEDLNAASHINADVYSRPPPRTPFLKDQGPKAKHIYVIGKRFNAWESWSPSYPHAAVKRIGNLRIVFSKTLPAPENVPIYGFQYLKTLNLNGNVLKPWLEPYQVDCAADGAGYDHAAENDRGHHALLRELVQEGHVAEGHLALPIDAHPDAPGAARSPFLLYDVYDEAVLWDRSQPPAEEGAAEPEQKTLLPETLEEGAQEAAEEAAAEEKEPPTQVYEGLDSEAIVPPWCPLMDRAQVAATSVVDLRIINTDHTYAPPPLVKFNAAIRMDLRRTPDALLGHASDESQSYVYVCASADAPSSFFVTSRLRILRALHALHLASQTPEADAAAAAGGEEEHAEGAEPRRNEVLDRLLEMGDAIDRATDGECGRIFTLDSADILEDVCGHIFLGWAWPRLKAVQDQWEKHEQGEHVMTDAERIETVEWSGVLRKVLPVLLRVLGQVRAVDGATLGAAACALSRLQMQAKDKKGGQAELARAIDRLEFDMSAASALGPRPALDPPVAACVSFDPPSLRPPDYALFDEEDEAHTLLLKPLPHADQDRLCLLTRLYMSWIDLSLRVHLKGAGTSVKRAAAPGDPHEQLALLEQGSSNRLALSNPEAGLLSRLGENPYLRCLLYLAIARRRPEVASQALGKACAEVESAVAQELDLWAFCEKELNRQQQVLRDGEEFESAFRKKATSKKPQANPPLPFSRSPNMIRLRTPPLVGSPVPPLLANSMQLEVPTQEYAEAHHSQRLQKQQKGKLAMACSVFGKTSGTGTLVSDQHFDLPGTGIRRGGYECVEITGIKPNTNYSFASLYYEGFEAIRQPVSGISETSAAIGSYYPLPIALLRVEICKASLVAGEAGAATMKRTWPALFGSMCERAAPAEDLNSFGLRTYKLRLDVVDRMPPAVLTAFAELVLLKNSPSAGVANKAFPATKQAQLSVLRSANECLLAVDCARRANDSRATLRGVSLTMHILARLLQLRTKPQPLLSALMKCAAVLEAFPPSERQLTWYSKSRVMAMSLIHYITLMGVQLRQVEVLQKPLAGDLPERYAPNEACDPAARAIAEARVLDQALELALLGGDSWAFAEAKAKVALSGHPSAEELLRLLKVLSDQDFPTVVKDAAALMLQEQNHPFALTLLLCAAGRAWEKGGIEDSLNEVLGKHPSAAMLELLLTSASQRLSRHGYMLRSNPTAILKQLEERERAIDAEEAKEAEDGTEKPPEPEEPADPKAKAKAKAKAKPETPREEEKPEDPLEGFDEPPEPDPLEELAKRTDTSSLAQLELLRAGPLLVKLCNLRFHKRDIASFKFVDLHQVAVPSLQPEEMPPEDVAEGQEAPAEEDGGAQAAAPEGEGEAPPLEEWQKQQQQDAESRKEAFELLRQLLRKLARAGAYANATGADRLMQRVLTTALNALLIAEPNPEDCVPPGVKGDPKDLDADRFVGTDLFPQPEEDAPPPPEPEDPKAKKGKDAKDAKGKPAEEPPTETAPEPEVNDVWISLAVLLDQAVTMLNRLKMGGADPAASNAEQEEEPDEEVALIKSANDSVRALEAADEVVNDSWWEKVQDLDITSIAKLMAFSLQCLYHMRRWESVLALARSFNDVTCSMFATTFLPLIVGAQREVVKLAANTVENTQRYLADSKREFEEAQKAIPKKVMRQLNLTGQLSEPEKLFRRCKEYYDLMLRRQNALHGAWEKLLKCFETTAARAIKSVPAAVEQLRKSRMLLGELLRDRQSLQLGLRSGEVAEEERPMREKALRIAAVALISSYRKAIELLRKRQLYDQVVHALHELGNLQWLEGDQGGAQSSWSDGVDTVFETPFAIKNWKSCKISPPEDWAGAEVMLIALVLLAKTARLGSPKDVSKHLDVALFSSNIVEAMMTTSLPHPSKRTHLSPDRYRLREIFYGLKESRAVLPPNTVYGGVDSPTFLGALSFFHDTLLSTEHQQARCVPICALYNYIATEVVRDRDLALKGRLMMARGLIRCRSLSSAWLAMYTVARNHDRPRALLGNEALDQMVAEAKEVAGLKPYGVNEEPFTEGNMAAVKELVNFVVVPDGDGNAPDPTASLSAAKAKAAPAKSKTPEPGQAAEAAPSMPAGTVEHHFRFLQAEFLLSVCSYGHVSSQPGDDGSKKRQEWLQQADEMLAALWADVTGNENDLDAWSQQLRQSQEKRGSGAEGEREGQPSVATPVNVLSEEAAELCAEIRLQRALAWELRGDLGRAVQEVLYTFHFLQALAKPPADGKTANRFRAHPGVKLWARLRRRMVQLLMSQGRHEAALSHIKRGLQECQSTSDALTQVELLAARARVEITRGRFLELRGERRLGALPTLQCCLTVASKALPLATPAAISARMMLASLLEQNPTLADMGETEVAPPGGEGDPEQRPSEPEDPHEEMNLQAQGKIIMSPIAKELRTRKEAPSRELMAQAAVERRRQLASLVHACVQDLDRLLDAEEFELHPQNLNSMVQIGEVGSRERAALDVLPARASSSQVPQTSDDSREPPNMYLDVMPMRLHCELRLASLRMQLGDFEGAGGLLREAEVRMTRCVHLLPWLFMQFCALKLQWRRLARPAGAPPADATNAQWYRDESAFEDGICPPAISPLFRTFLKRAYLPLLTTEGEWRPRSQPPAAGSDEGLRAFFVEFAGVMEIGLYEGGNDHATLSLIAREGLEEVLAVKQFATPSSTPEPLPPAAQEAPAEGAEGAAEAEAEVAKPVAAYDLAHAVFCCLVAVAESRKALRFKDPKAMEDAGAAGGKDAKGKDAKGGGGGGGAAPVDAAAVPRRAALDIQRHIKRQAFEGGLAYSAGAQQELEKSIPFKTAVKHIEAIQQECAMFDSAFHAERQLCDQMHVALAKASEAYRSAKVVDGGKLNMLKQLDTLAETPTSGDSFVHWMLPDVPAPETGFYGAPPNECCEFLLFVCPIPREGEDTEQSPPKPFLARCRDVSREALRRLGDGLAADLAHCRPAIAVSTEYVETRLRSVASVLRGAELGGVEAKEILSVEAKSALKALLISMEAEGAEGDAAAAAAAATAKAKAEPKKDAKKASKGPSGRTASGSKPPSRQVSVSAERQPAATLDSQHVQSLLEALGQLLDAQAPASQVSHLQLGLFLQAVLEPLRLVPA